MPQRVRGLTVLLALGLTLSGCGAKTFSLRDIYFHDATLEGHLKKAKADFAEVASGSASVWATMQSNLDKAAMLESEALGQSAVTRRRAAVNNMANKKWKEIRDTADESKKAAAEAIADLKDRINSTAKGIDVLTKLVAEGSTDPLAKAVENSTVDSPKLVELKTALANLAQSIDKLGPPVTEYFKKLSAFLDFADTTIKPALQRTGHDPGLANVLTILRKAKHPELIKEIQEAAEKAEAAGQNLAAAPIPLPVKDAAKKYLGLDLATVGDLTKYMKTETPALAEIRLSLEQLAAQTLADIRRAQLDAAKERLRLYNSRLAVVTEKAKVAIRLATQMRKDPRPTEETVLASLEEQYGAYSATVDKTTRTRTREVFTQRVANLTDYVQLIGSLNRWDKITQDQLLVLDHRAGIEDARVKTAGYEKLVSLGLAGTLTFAEGGVTEENVANWLRAAQTIGIAVIGARIQ